jgi:hypothetical protein
MATVSGSDPVELRVLSALTSGASTVFGVAAEVGEPESVVGPVLEGSVAEQTALRLDLPGLPTYALTPKGLALLGVSPGAQAAVDDAPQDHVPVAPDAVAPDAPTEEPLVPPDPAPPHVRRRHVAYAAAYVVVGLLLLTVTPILGELAVVAGLVLGGFALRPLFASSSTRVSGR